MAILLTLGSCIAAIAIVAIVAMRLLLKKKSKEVSFWMESTPPFQSTLKNREEAHRQDDECVFNDIESDLEQTFKGRYITFREERQFTEYYTELFHRVSNFLKRLDTFHVESPDIIAKFVSDFENLQWFVKSHNDNYIKEKLDTFKDFFDHCLKYPLDRVSKKLSALRVHLLFAFGCLVLLSSEIFSGCKNSSTKMEGKRLSYNT